MDVISTKAGMARVIESVNQAVSVFPKCQNPHSSLCSSVSCANGGECLSVLSNSILRLTDELYRFFETERITLEGRDRLEDTEIRLANHRKLAAIVRSASQQLLLPQGYRLATSELKRFMTCFEQHVSGLDLEL